MEQTVMVELSKKEIDYILAFLVPQYGVAKGKNRMMIEGLIDKLKPGRSG